MVENFTDSSKNLELLFDCVADGVYAVDQEMRLIYLNRSVEALLGVTREELLGQSCHDVFHSVLCTDGCPVREAMDKGVPVQNWEFVLRLDAHRNVPIAGNAARLVDPDGKIIGGVMTLRNLTATVEINQQITEKYKFCDILSCSPAMQRIFEILIDVAASEATILITGESGTGKELVAKAIHTLSARREGPMVIVNCGAFPEPLLEAELFGVKRGACTDAKEDRSGRIAMAEGGTLLLDEIGDLPLSLQVKLLRVIENHEYQMLGDSAPQYANVRFLATTHCDMEAMVAAGVFRRDLYFRLNAAHLSLPPLHERREDIPLLGNMFLERFNQEFAKQVRGITAEACQCLQQYSFPGNVRELMHLIEQLVIMSRDQEIGIEHLPEHIVNAVSNCDRWNEQRSPQRPTKEAVNAVLARHGDSRTKAAAELGIDRTTLWRWLRSMKEDPALFD